MKSYSESGFDKIIYNNFFNSIDSGTLVEVGAGHPVEISTSLFYKERGWRTISIDPNPKFVKLHKEAGREIYEYACGYEDKDDVNFYVYADGNEMSYSSLGAKYRNVNYYEIKVRVRTLNSILDNLNITKLDIVTIDTEGWEIEVMQGFDTNKYSPEVIVLENIYNNSNYHNYMNDIGYTLYQRIAINEIYKR
jgi:FkbM family methyltransferase